MSHIARLSSCPVDTRTLNGADLRNFVASIQSDGPILCDKLCVPPSKTGFIKPWVVTIPTRPPLRSAASVCSDVLLRVRRDRDGRVIDVAVVGVVEERLQFGALVDCLPAPTFGLSRPRFIATPSQLLPSVPADYQLRDPVALHSWDVETRADGSKVVKGMGRGIRVTRVSYGSPSPTSPSPSQAAYVDAHVTAAERRAIEALLASKPAWLAEDLLRCRFTERRSKAWVIARCFTYSFLGGPFDRVQLRLGFDPRSSPAAWRFQRVTFEVDEYLAPQVAELSSVVNISAKLRAVRPQRPQLGERRHDVFSRLIAAGGRRTSFLMEDLDDGAFHRLVEDMRRDQLPFDPVSGWFTPKMLERIAHYIREDFAAFVRTTAIPAARQEIAETELQGDGGADDSDDSSLDAPLSDWSGGACSAESGAASPHGSEDEAADASSSDLSDDFGDEMIRDA